MLSLFLKTFFLVLSVIVVSNPGMISSIFFHEQGTDFVPINYHELLQVHSSIFTAFSCSFLCHNDLQCRTFVFNPPTCRLYQGARETGQIISVSSTSSIVGEILCNSKSNQYTNRIEWWKAFDNNYYSYWNSGPSFVPNYLYITFDDEYLLTSFQLTVVGNTTHDPQLVEYYLDENANYLGENFTFAHAPSQWYTFAPTPFNYEQNPIVAKT